MLLHDVFDDATYERQRSVGLFDGEQRHAREVNECAEAGRRRNAGTTHYAHRDDAEPRLRATSGSARAVVLFPLTLLETTLSTLFRRFVPTDLVDRFRFDRRNIHRAAVAVHGDEREIAGVRVTSPATLQV